MESAGTQAALKANGEIWGWGWNYYGVLDEALAVSGSISSPVLITGSHSFVQVDCGTYHFVALKGDGSAWGWGGNYGQLGTGVVPWDLAPYSYSSPVACVGGHVFTQLVTGSGHTLGLKANGEVWAWGQNYGGELGNGVDGPSGAPGTYDSPGLVVGAHSFVRIHAGDGASFALKANGELWAWGQGTGGTLGINSNLHTTSPVLVVGGHLFVWVDGGAYGAATRALKANGELWGWGAYSCSSPVLVVAAATHSWVQITQNGACLKANGEVWVGVNSSPVLLAGNHSFVQIAQYPTGFQARKRNGEVWAWGTNYYGQIGDGTRTDRTSPVRVIGGHLFKTLPGVFPAEAKVLARPQSDVTDGGWTNELGSNVNLAASVDEVSPDDADWIKSSAAANDTCVLQLSPIDPISPTAKVQLRVRARRIP
jgi:alpha-tubulin suppressor-like RCC1 family protein